ncbi:HNH endonuclease [Leucobacter sp. W1478]|uniref:HNH endonuclease n=1 Tax=Leucobacter sp. W1478 TaxID=3439065 RepID=UPI003F315F59
MLEEWIQRSLGSSGFQVLALPSHAAKPYRFALFEQENGYPTVVRIYAWNATHGGGSHRAADEFRIQITGHVPETISGEQTIILGWSAEFNVFVGWDSNFHIDRRASSPSLQVRADTMKAASTDGIAAARRGSGDVVVAVRPELLAAYCVNAEEIHSNPTGEIVERINAIALREPMEPSAEFGERRKIERTMRMSYRTWDFSERVRKAYRVQCAMCSIGMILLESAHIVPVAWPGSTDETRNGIALCRNHHRAYDSSLITVDPDYTVRVSWSRAVETNHATAIANEEWLKTIEGKTLRHLPDLKEDRPYPEYLVIGQEARRWYP